MIKISSALLLFLFSSCDIINPEEEIPSFLFVPAAKLTTNKSEEGVNSHKITDVWAFKDDQFIGSFATPATIPILEKGDQEIQLVAGIQVNGISTTRAQYPFFSSFDSVINLTPKKFDTICPTFQYQDRTTFKLLEDFEDGNSFFQLDRLTNSPEIKYGSGAGHLHIPATSDTTFFFESKDAFELPGQGKPVFLEMDYKSELDISAGLRLIRGAQSQDVFNIVIRNRQTWNKIYINYTTEATQGRADEFKVIFKVIINKINQDADIYLDNIKLVHQ